MGDWAMDPGTSGEVEPDRRVPSEAYRERVRAEMLADPQTQREIAEFHSFLAGLRVLAERDAARNRLKP